jgi:hypothetical protein
MMEHPDKYNTLSSANEAQQKPKVGWTYSKIMAVNGIFVNNDKPIFSEELKTMVSKK